MKRGLSTALALAASFNLLAGLTAADGPAPQPAPTPRADEAQGGRTVASPVIGGGQPAKSEVKREHHKRRAKATAVKAAGAGSVTIKDFSYAPKSVAVNVGDTVTWSNQGPTDHTATAKDGSFDTGLLKKGQSGSHTFTKAGTFSYFCTIHPFMKATVVVAAARGSGGSGGSGGSTGSSGSGSGGSRSSGEAASASKQALPKSGVDVGSMVLSGALLLLSGLVLRRRTTGASG
jgi:plastocyanin